jgi:hypothetical protein
LKKWFFKDEKIHWSELKRKKRPDPFSFSSKNAVSGGPQIGPGRIEKIDRLNLENAKSAFGGREQEFRAGIGGGPELRPNSLNKKINIEAVFHSFWETFLRRFFQRRRARFVAYHCAQFYHRNQRFFERAARKGRSGELPNNDKAIGSTDNAKADNAGAGDAGADDAKADNARTDNAKAGAPRISVHPKGRIFPQQKSKCQKKLKIRQTHPS